MHRPRPQLPGHAGGVYKRASCEGDPSGPLAAMGETLGLELRIEDDRIVLSDPAAQEYPRINPQSAPGTKRNATSASQPNSGPATWHPIWQPSRNGTPNNLRRAPEILRVALQRLGTRRTPKGLRLLWRTVPGPFTVLICESLSRIHEHLTC